MISSVLNLKEFIYYDNIWYYKQYLQSTIQSIKKAVIKNTSIIEIFPMPMMDDTNKQKI